MNRSVRSVMPIRADLRVALMLSLAGAVWMMGLWPAMLSGVVLWAVFSFAEVLVR